MKNKPGPSPIEAQTIKIFKHIRTNSYKSRARYMSSVLNFIKFCFMKYRLENIRNINNEHIVAYIIARQDDHIAEKTISNDLSAIRFFMDHVSNPRYEISSNTELEDNYDLTIGNNPLNPGNRAWTDSEYDTFVEICNKVGSNNPIDVSILCKTMGLRITEAVASSRAQAEYALRTGLYQVKQEAKNGRWRKIPLSIEAKKMFTRRLNDVPRGGHIFIKTNQKTHQAVNEYEQFLHRLSKRITTEEGILLRTYRKSSKNFINNITWHGLRYCYTQNRMQQLIQTGFTYSAAQQIISNELGHNRLSVVETYIGKNGAYLIKNIGDQ